MRSLSVTLSLSALAGASAFVPATPFMGSAVKAPAVAQDAKMTMVFGGGAKKSGKSSVKAGGKAAPKAKATPNYLKTPEAGVGSLGAWYVRDDPTLSTALPWVTKPEIGDGSLVGDFGFDPFGLAKIFDVNWLRAAELKHGRLSMLAVLGFVTPELVQKPSGFEGFHFAPEFTELNAIKALGSVPKLGLAQIALVIAFAEIGTFSKAYNEKYNYEDNLTPLERKKVVEGKFKDLSGAAVTQGKAGVNTFGDAVDVGFQDPDSKAVPGDLGFDPLGLADNGINPAYALSEIKHARLAMVGALGMLAQELVQDKGIIAQTAAWANGQ